MDFLKHMNLYRDRYLKRFKRNQVAHCLVLFSVLFTLTPSSYADQGNTLLAEDVEAFNMIKPAASKGYPAAQRMLASMYEQGEGVEKNLDLAIHWYTKAANKDDDIAQFYLGYMHYQGIGMQKDISKAFSWFAKAAKHGNPDFEYNLGNLYRYGDGVTQNIKLAVVWYQKAAIHDSLDAQQALVDMYFTGSETKKDLVQAYVWQSILDSDSPLLVEIRKQLSNPQWQEAQSELKAWRQR